ncbi:MAG: SEC-C metal-binding domain-containing protein [Gammaproteobacteria bacterium]|nr:SEC-C metal-binding domain-containing protein [Gammaproteobacteria bacterium]
MEEFDVSNSEFNALVIGDLIDMEAVEALPSIKLAYEKECVDYSIQGDYEDVEIYMGVRKKRATPVNYPGILDKHPGFKELIQSIATQQNTQPVTQKKSKIGRNDPCPCGSGKKYKKCYLG